MTLRSTARALYDEFERHDLLSRASAIAFRLLSALVPFLLMTLSLVGFLHLSTVWSSDLAPTLQRHVTQADYALINQTALRVLRSDQAFWLTLGAVIAIWEVSGAVRAVMGGLDDVYESADRRAFWPRIRVSIVLAFAVAACFLLALAFTQIGPLVDKLDLPGGVAAVVYALRWVLALAMLTVAVGLLVHYGSSTRMPIPWVTFGTLIVIAAWSLMSVGFAIYVTRVAAFGSIFVNLASVLVLLTYLYLTSIVLLGGVALDAIVRREVRMGEGKGEGEEEMRGTGADQPPPRAA